MITALFSMKSKVCPKCGHQKFLVTAHVVQEWEVDKDGNFLETANECVEVTHNPSDDDLWRCSNCGFEASGREMKV